jgi:hypothetical protein
MKLLKVFRLTFIKQGSLSDRFGKKWFIVTAAAIGFAGSIASATAHRTTTVIIGNIFTGLANAGCIMGVPASQEGENDAREGVRVMLTLKQSRRTSTALGLWASRRP